MCAIIINTEFFLFFFTDKLLIHQLVTINKERKVIVSRRLCSSNWMPTPRLRHPTITVYCFIVPQSRSLNMLHCLRIIIHFCKITVNLLIGPGFTTIAVSI